MPKKNTTVDQSAQIETSTNPAFDFQPIVEPEIPPSQYEEAIQAFLSRVTEEGQGLQLTGTLSYAMNLVQARSHLKAPVKITWDKPAKGQKGVNTTIRLYLDHSLSFEEERA